MPHEQSRPSSTTGYARYVGRVGALAVGLGIGAAIFSSAGLAHADEDASGSPSGSSAPSGASDTKDAPASAASKTTPDENPSEQNATTHDAKDADGKLADAEPSTTVARVVQIERKAAKAPRVDETADRPVQREKDEPAPAPAVSVDAPPIRAMTAASTASPPAPPASASTAVAAAPSPLGTQQQLEAEKRATETVNTLPVALMQLVLRFGFLAAAQQQFAQVGGPDRGNLDQLDAAVNEYAMGAAFQQQILNSNDPTVVMQVAPPHTWYGQGVLGSRILYDNPDTIYRFMGVNAASSYVIAGRFTGERPADTTFSVLTGLSGNTASVLGGRDLVVGQDGRFTITVSRDAAAPGQTNHLQLTNDSTLIATRNTLSDWGAEVPMTLSIERVGGPPNSLFSQLGGFAIPGLGPLVIGNPWLTTLVSLIPPMAHPPPLLRGAIAAVIMALGIQREAAYMAVATTDPETGRQIQPNVLKDPARNAEFLATQLQSAGYFQLADDEALVVTIDPGNAGYFVLPVTNDWTISKDYWNDQTSLNDSQAIANSDGTYTLVISKTDPGVANWVSTGGLNQGTISMRFQDLDPDSADRPSVSSQVVALDQLPATLPPGTVYYTRAQRQAQLSVRKAGFDNRFAPYPQP
ncbi:MAG: DUF1214 domain-containing protein [Mycolicibacterium sp.]|nr:hypothetical protein [Mycolicibacterium sp.]MBJ7341736.1 DUF1214 domain-containing protein [Mycolicibacterium sp.]